MNSITQNFKNVLKNKIKVLINPILYNTIDFIVENILTNNDENRYYNFISGIQDSLRNLIKSVLVTTIEEIDKSFKVSAERCSRYYINKSNVKRTLTTIVGDVTFNRTYYKNKFNESYIFYIDDYLGLPKSDHYDPIVKAIAIDKAIHTSQAQAARDTSASISNISYFFNYSQLNNISRQSIYNWIKKWNVPDIVPKAVETPETLYVMADEKFIGAQDIEKDIMVKSFVTFEDVKAVGKHRNKLINRTVFSCYDTNAWPLFMDFISKKYDFSKIKNICLLADGGKWIKTGIAELKLDPNNHVKFYLCEFHFKQAIHRITTDTEEREKLLEIFKEKSKKDFTDAVNLIIENNPKAKEKIQKNLDYIINNYTAIKSMLALKIGSSMESHISHLIASFFSARPKGFSTKRVKQYLKLNDYKNNKINIFRLYLESYLNKETITINEESLCFPLFGDSNSSNIPIINNGKVSNEYNLLKSLAH